MATIRVYMVAITMATIFELAMGAYYIVGDSSNWDLNVDYTKWASNKPFQPGDTLGFIYNSSQHNVLEVSSDDYTACNNSNPIIKYSSTGNTNITFPLRGIIGPKYFICGVDNHCANGMKLQINAIILNSSPDGAVGAADSLCMAVKIVLTFVFTAYFVFVVL